MIYTQKYIKTWLLTHEPTLLSCYVMIDIVQPNVLLCIRTEHSGLGEG